MSSTTSSVEAEESSRSPSPPPPSGNQAEESSSFKLSIKRGKTESGDVILTSEIINTSTSAEKDSIVKKEDKKPSALASSSPLVIEVLKKEGHQGGGEGAEAVKDTVKMESADGGAENGVDVEAGVVGESVVSGVSSEPLWMVGDVVWCLQRGNPWWPCLVTNEFNSEEHSRYINSGSRTVKQYHVQFFGPKPLHAWIHENSVRPFEDRNEVAGWKERDVAIFKKMSKPRREKAMKAYQPTSRAIIVELDAAKDEAEKALSMPVMERLDVFEFDYQSVGENSNEMTSDKRKVKFTPLKPGTTVVMMSAGNGGRVGDAEVKPLLEDAAVVGSSSLSTSLPISEPASPPSKRRRTIANTVAESNSSIFNNNDVKVDNNNITGDGSLDVGFSIINNNNSINVSSSKSSMMKYPMMLNSLMIPKNSPERNPNAIASSSSSPERGMNNNNNYSDCEDEEEVSPKDNPDVFSKFSLCHSAEMRSQHPDLSAESIEAKLREQWNSMTDEEANWYIYNGVPPGKLLPGKKRPRPKKFLDRFVEAYSKRLHNGLES